jgi:hypothetical protein
MPQPKTGVFPGYTGSVYEKQGISCVNPPATTSPHGTLSMIAVFSGMNAFSPLL